MLTPAMVSEIAKYACVTCRAKPSFWMRRGALLNIAQNIGKDRTLVASGVNAEGNCPASVEFCGPGSVALLGFAVVLTAPCGGSSGLPNEAALAAAAAVATLPAAVMANHLRRDRDSMCQLPT